MKQIYFTNDVPRVLFKTISKRCRRDGIKKDEVIFHYVDMLNSILTGEIKKADIVVCSPIYYRRLKSFFMEYSINIPLCRYHWTRGRYAFPEVVDK